MRRRHLPLVLLASAALFAAGCGGDDDDSSGSSGSEATATATETATAAETETAAPEEEGGTEAAGDGEQLFADTCGSCHTLAAAGTNGTFGPNLDDLQPDKERVLAAISSGPGQMPENLLEGADAEAVADYVSTSAGQ